MKLLTKTHSWIYFSWCPFPFQSYPWSSYFPSSSPDAFEILWFFTAPWNLLPFLPFSGPSSPQIVTAPCSSSHPCGNPMSQLSSGLSLSPAWFVSATEGNGTFITHPLNWVLLQAQFSLRSMEEFALSLPSLLISGHSLLSTVPLSSLGYFWESTAAQCLCQKLYMRTNNFRFKLFHQKSLKHRRLYKFCHWRCFPAELAERTVIMEITLGKAGEFVLWVLC